MNRQLILTPSDFIAITNQILENAFNFVYIEGEIANFRISKNKWVYFDIKDEFSKVSCFASIYILPGPLTDGLMVKIGGQPRLHPQFGFSINLQSIAPSGEGSIKKAYELLKLKLTKEGLFDESRKRLLPHLPNNIALVTSVESAAYTDFIKIMSNRWPFVEIIVYDTQVQGEAAATQIVHAMDEVNNEPKLADLVVITRGGGSIDDLSVFDDERVIRQISASRVPTLVAIGHERDISLSELVADKRASTPSNAAEIIVPDKTSELSITNNSQARLKQFMVSIVSKENEYLENIKTQFVVQLKSIFINEQKAIRLKSQILSAYNPKNILKRGYAIIRADNGLVIKSIKAVSKGQFIELELDDGKFKANVSKIK